jgi:hypothetical protein
MHGMIHAPQAGLLNRVARLVSRLVNSKSLTAEFQHFRHKRQTIETAIPVECGEDLCFVSYFHNLSHA